MRVAFLISRSFLFERQGSKLRFGIGAPFVLPTGPFYWKTAAPPLITQPNDDQGRTCSAACQNGGTDNLGEDLK